MSVQLGIRGSRILLQDHHIPILLHLPQHQNGMPHMQELEAQQAELQTTENRYAEVKLWLDSFAEHIQSGAIMNADDSMIMKQLVEQIIVGDDGIEVHFKCGIVASHEYL